MAKKRAGYGDLYCVMCGGAVEKDASSCPQCGHKYDSDDFGGAELLGAGGIGWSQHADDPCFKQSNKKNVFGMIIVMMIVSLIILAVILFTSDMDISEVLPIFGGVMVIEWTFWIVWLIGQYASRKDWEGTVERKESYQQEYTEKDGDGYRHKYTRMIYKLHFRKVNGKKKTLVSSEPSGWYDYLREGDRIRYHGKNMNYYEKYDKSREKFIPCASCGSKRDPRENYCGRCGCILLKAPAPVSAQQAFAAYRPSANETPYAIPVSKPGEANADINASPKFCPYCGAKTNGGKFCTECGEPLRAQHQLQQ